MTVSFLTSSVRLHWLPPGHVFPHGWCFSECNWGFLSSKISLDFIHRRDLLTHGSLYQELSFHLSLKRNMKEYAWSKKPGIVGKKKLPWSLLPCHLGTAATHTITIWPQCLETYVRWLRCFISVSPGIVTMATGSEQQVSPEEWKYRSSLWSKGLIFLSHRRSNIIHHQKACDINDLFVFNICC